MFLIRFLVISSKINFFWILVNACWLNCPHIALVKIQFLVTKTLQKLMRPSIWLSECIWGLKNVHLHLIHRSYTGILIKLILTISFESWILVIFHILAKIYIFSSKYKWSKNTVFGYKSTPEVRLSWNMASSMRLGFKRRSLTSNPLFVLMDLN